MVYSSCILTWAEAEADRLRAVVGEVGAISTDGRAMFAPDGRAAERGKDKISGVCVGRSY